VKEEGGEKEGENVIRREGRGEKEEREREWKAFNSDFWLRHWNKHNNEATHKYRPVTTSWRWARRVDIPLAQYL